MHQPKLNKSGNWYIFDKLIVGNIEFGREYQVVLEAKNEIDTVEQHAVKYIL